VRGHAQGGGAAGGGGGGGGEGAIRRAFRAALQRELAGLYQLLAHLDALAAHAPPPGARVGRAAAIGGWSRGSPEFIKAEGNEHPRATATTYLALLHWPPWRVRPGSKLLMRVARPQLTRGP
jgi:hypothetical protein